MGLQIVANLAVLAQPFLPFTAEKLVTMLNLNNKDWQNAGTVNMISHGHQLAESKLLFEKITDEEVQFQLEKLEKASLENAKALAVTAPPKDNISFDEFSAMDIRTGKIVAAEKVAKTKKLLKLTVDTGLDQRIVVSGIAEFYKPEEIIGKQVSILVNLEPRAIKGIQSQGMILMAEDNTGKLSFVAPMDDIEAGSVVR